MPKRSSPKIREPRVPKNHAFSSSVSIVISQFLSSFFPFYEISYITWRFCSIFLSLTLSRSLSLSFSLSRSPLDVTSYRFISNFKSLFFVIFASSRILQEPQEQSRRWLSNPFVSLFLSSSPDALLWNLGTASSETTGISCGLAPPSSTVRSSSDLVFTLPSCFERRPTRAPTSSFPLGSFASSLCWTGNRVGPWVSKGKKRKKKKKKKKKERNPAKRKRPTNVTHEDRHRSAGLEPPACYWHRVLVS